MFSYICCDFLQQNLWQTSKQQLYVRHLALTVSNSGVMYPNAIKEIIAFYGSCLDFIFLTYALFLNQVQEIVKIKNYNVLFLCRSIMNKYLNLLLEFRMNFKCEKCYSMQTKMKLIIFDFILTNFHQPRPVNVLINFFIIIISV